MSEKKSGTITLYNGKGVKLTFMRYSHEAQRKKHLEAWKLTYGERFKTFYYEIAPDLDPEAVERVSLQPITELRAVA
jgi:hypothetical protein